MQSPFVVSAAAASSTAAAAAAAAAAAVFAAGGVPGAGASILRVERRSNAGGDERPAAEGVSAGASCCAAI